MPDPKKYHCASCLTTMRVGDDIRHELNCPNLNTAHNPDVSRVTYKPKTFTVQSTDPQIALSTVSMWECVECGALVDEQLRHSAWHINDAKRFYELQRRTNRVRVKHPKETAPTQGRVKTTQGNESEEVTDAPTESQRRKVKKRHPMRATLIVRRCNAAKDTGVQVGGEKHICTCELDMDPEHEMHRCPACKIGWTWTEQPAPISHDTLVRMMKEIAKEDRVSTQDVVEVQISDGILDALIADRSVSESAQEIRNNGSMGTILGIPFVVDDRCIGASWNIITKPRGGNAGVTAPLGWSVIGSV